VRGGEIESVRGGEIESVRGGEIESVRGGEIESVRGGEIESVRGGERESVRGAGDCAAAQCTVRKAVHLQFSISPALPLQKLLLLLKPPQK
jgi:hypothetical protein